MIKILDGSLKCRVVICGGVDLGSHKLYVISPSDIEKTQTSDSTMWHIQFILLLLDCTLLLVHMIAKRRKVSFSK